MTWERPGTGICGGSYDGLVCAIGAGGLATCASAERELVVTVVTDWDPFIDVTGAMEAPEALTLVRAIAALVD